MSMRISTNQFTQRLAADITRQQSELAAVQEQITSGKRINRPSDDPAHAGRLLGMEQATSQLAQFDRNASAAESRLSLEETALTGITNTLMRVRELALSANNGAVDDSTRTAIRAEVEQKLSELYDLGNMRDSNGGYLFSGSNTQNQPFSRQVPVGYAGSDDAQRLPVGLGRTVATGDSGADVFMRIRNGNGHFSTTAAAANTGTGIVSSGSVSNAGVYDTQPYRIDFTSPTSYNIIDVNSGGAVQTGVAFSEDTAIEFSGITTSISGTPATGDSFDIIPSRNQDLFATVAAFSDTLTNNPTSPAGRASLQQAMDNTLADLDQALEHVNTARARVGSRLTTVDSSREENTAVMLQLDRARAEIEDVDIADAVTRLQSRISSMEILQKSFARVESLSLFNYM